MQLLPSNATQASQQIQQLRIDVRVPELDRWTAHRFTGRHTGSLERGPETVRVEKEH